MHLFCLYYSKSASNNIKMDSGRTTDGDYLFVMGATEWDAFLTGGDWNMLRLWHFVETMNSVESNECEHLEYDTV
jgi:hypothetical protein